MSSFLSANSSVDARINLEYSARASFLLRIRCGIFESVFRLQDDIRGWLENNKCRFLLF